MIEERREGRRDVLRVPDPGELPRNERICFALPAVGTHGDGEKRATDGSESSCHR
jgi:hypothetical protein